MRSYYLKPKTSITLYTFVIYKSVRMDKKRYLKVSTKKGFTKEIDSIRKKSNMYSNLRN